MAYADRQPHEQPLSPEILTLQADLLGGKARRLDKASHGELELELLQGQDSLWVVVRRPDKGGVALRAGYFGTGSFSCSVKRPGDSNDCWRIEVKSPLGLHVITVDPGQVELHRLRITVALRPSGPLKIPFLPRDLYPLDSQDRPTGASGTVEASQRGVNSGLVYLRIERPQFGSVLYFQNLTALNPYFTLTATTPEAVVGGDWPELGYLAPVCRDSESDADKPFPEGQEVTLSDAIVVFHHRSTGDEQEQARRFVQMLGAAYSALDLPPVEYRDWADRSRRTLRDLETSDKATVRHYGERFVMPYVEGEVPDCMVQLSLAASLTTLQKWRGEDIPLRDELLRGARKFHDRKLGMLRRFLPNAGQDKDLSAVDSWYLYHPLVSLSRLAAEGNQQALDLLLACTDYAIKAAHHFQYRWPIEFKSSDFAVITENRGDQPFGQTDVNGIYAYLMVQLFRLTGQDRYLQEARASVEAAQGLKFDLIYQANLTVWGAVACLRLWRITGDETYLRQSYVYLAGVLHNCEIWDSQIGNAVHYSNFLGATCLHDAPYMAMFECFECFTGFEEYLANSGPELEPAARMLVSEFCKYALQRAWFYFPDTLPRDILHPGPYQSGVLAPELSFPLEDLYGDGQAPGQIGQEIYGAGGAFLFATRSTRNIDGVPFTLWCDHFVRAAERSGERTLAIELGGGGGCTALLCTVRQKRHALPSVRVQTSRGDQIDPRASTPDRAEFLVPANGRIVLVWD